MPDFDEPDAAYSKQDPEPAQTAGLEAGGGIDPGDTPATAGQMSGTAPDAHKAPNMGPVSGNRTPMVITLGFLALIAIAFAVIVGASFIAS
jgi:hypothetical protein